MRSLHIINMLFGLLFFVQVSAEKNDKPNIIVILGDDIGFSDIGCYGSEIQTPNLDKLAEKGLRFSHFYNLSKCEPSRSALFTGTYQGGQNAVNMVGLLREAGYFTIHSGKEHFLKSVPNELYAINHNDRSLTFEAANEFFEPPSGKFSKPFILNGKEVSVKEIYHEIEPFFKDDAFTDNAIKWIDEAIEQKKPFFLFVGFGAGHYPLQARPADIAKYRGKYMKGWDQLRAERLEKLKKLKIIPESTVLSPPSANINKFRGHPEGDDEIRAKIPLYRPWNEINDKEKNELDLEMAVYAAMVDRLDQNVGRIVKKVEDEGLENNTIIIFLSDNGSCPYDSNRDFEFQPGDARGFRTLSAAWANLGNTPFRFFKQYGHEGGTRTHCIVNWPGKIKPGAITNQPGHITDLMPTLLEISDTGYPATRNSIATQKLDGSSLLPVFTGEKRTAPKFMVSGWTEKFRMYIEGDWKIVKVNGLDWELYNLNDDPTEMINLAQKYPEKVKTLENNYMASSFSSK